MHLDIDGTMKRISYLHLYPIHFSPDEETNLPTQVRWSFQWQKLFSLWRERWIL